MSAYGNKLNPYRKIREPRGVKGIRQRVSKTNNPSTIDQNQQEGISPFPHVKVPILLVRKVGKELHHK